MAETRRYIPDHTLNIEQILEEAKHRWLRPTEILEILRNYQKFKLTAEPPASPAAGSMFLFDRKALRYFRKDGHRWRKKKDGKTVREAHEKLKAGSVDVLHCYYAHGEDNENFQRRCYWMLDGQLEHIVFVHYREVKEGYKSGVSRLLEDSGTQVENLQPSSVTSFAQAASPASTVQTSYASSPNKIDWNGKALSSEFEDVDSRNGPGTSSRTQSIHGSMSHNSSLLVPRVEGFHTLPKNPPRTWFAGAKFDHGTKSSLLPGQSVFSLPGQNFFVDQPGGAEFITHKLTDATLEGNAVSDTVVSANGLITDRTATPQNVIQELDFNLISPQFHNLSGTQTVAASTAQVENKAKDGGANNIQSGELKKLDSFGRWMDKEIGGDCNDSLMASDSGNYWSTLSAENEDKEVSSLSHHMQLDIDSLGPSLSQDQLFSIRDFSPDWAYSGVDTKVLIIGTFLGSKKFSSETKWGCMFGEIEVSAEVLNDCVIRCQVPQHAPGHVPFYVTCRNRLSCSEVREFEYRENPSEIASLPGKNVQPEEILFQMHLAKLLYLGPGMKLSNCSIKDCESCKKISTLFYLRNDSKKDLGKVQDNCMVALGDGIGFRDKLIESLLRDRLCEWLACKVHEGGKGPDVLDGEGQGAIHLAAGLGYEWAMDLIVAASGNPNFRDARGRTALHWASYFGREETVIALIRLDADPTAVDDPTPAFPGGQSAADLASCRGHKGISGYLAEAFLRRHLSSLNIDQNEMDRDTATVAAEKETDIAAQVASFSSKGELELLSLKGSLAAVRKSARAVALIHAAYRTSSFRQRQLAKSSDDISEISLDLAALGSLNMVQKRGHFEDYLHSAAVKIQQKYRGWKGRKDFLKIRNRIVKIQAHVRGHQVRKQYKKVVWSVGIVEKAILRWRRKRTGLRGFRLEKTIGDVKPESEKADEYDFLRISRKQKFAGVENALARVTSMVRHPEARDQYMRMVTKFENIKMGDEGYGVSQQDESSR
ncbi:CALMODULIN-BINDING TRANSCRIPTION ACTIVATOR CAMTA [Salix viminalis]|uniref:CALMODULIN-BINDING TRANSCRIPTION ACTIVATOR CAMTA n=1 Tax=Salix viminalis TaxID=40686 RepID=A0A9Q0U002_SALVM|nr:CALMODULIN-BINDING TRANSCRIPTION ACTIVATOR CAMTA [Salix viminalis]